MLRLIPRTVWTLGFVSLFMDISSELIHSLLPVFMVSVLGTSVLWVGIVEGLAESTAQIIKVFSGRLSDRLRKRKLLVVIGYGLAACTKPLFPLAYSIDAVLSARFIDRVGKGIREAPRDALIGDIIHPEIRGAAFGLRQSLDSVGAFIGPILAIVFLQLYNGDLRAVLWIAVIPAFISLALVSLAVKEPDQGITRETRVRILKSDLAHLGKAYWWVVGLASMLTMARFSEAFLILKAQENGWQVAWIPGVLIIMNVAYALSAYPAGALSDRQGRKSVLLTGIAFLIGSHILLAASTNVWVVGSGIILWGLHMGFTQGLLTAMVADTTPTHLRGTAYGMYGLLTGITLLVSSVTAGLIWDFAGSSMTFITGAIFAGLTFYALKNRR